MAIRANTFSTHYESAKSRQHREGYERREAEAIRFLQEREARKLALTGRRVLVANPR